MRNAPATGLTVRNWLGTGRVDVELESVLEIAMDMSYIEGRTIGAIMIFNKGVEIIGSRYVVARGKINLRDRTYCTSYKAKSLRLARAGLKKKMRALL